MNVLKALMTAILRQLVTTLKEVSPVLVAMDSQAMDPIVQVNASVSFYRISTNYMHIHYNSIGLHIIFPPFL